MTHKKTAAPHPRSGREKVSGALQLRAARLRSLLLDLQRFFLHLLVQFHGRAFVISLQDLLLILRQFAELVLLREDLDPLRVVDAVLFVLILTDEILQIRHALFPHLLGEVPCP